MVTDLFEKLAEVPVPPPPESQTFDRAVHRRINDRLIVGQLFDFALRATAFAVVHFARAVLAALRLTFTGKLEQKNTEKPRDM